MSQAYTLEEQIKKLPPAELVCLKWQLQRRLAQTAPDPLPLIWCLLGGRGSGKTLTGANHIFEVAKNLPNTYANRIVRVALVSETFTDVRITMIEGETGMRSIIPRDLELAWNRSLGELKVVLPNPYREIHFFAYSSERPDLLRGPQHHLVWLDEMAKLKDADKEPTNPGTTWSNIMMGLRLGPTPHIVITGTPTPCKLIKYLVAHPDCVVNYMSTFDNEENLPQQTIEEMRRLPRTSRTARQELFAEILLDNPDSIFSAELIEQDRADPPEDEEQPLRRVLGYDPSMSASEESDEAGIILSGFTKTKEDGTHAYILEDHSGHLSPPEQVTTVANLIIDKEIPELIVEQNQGAGFVLNNLKTGFIAHPDVAQVDVREIKKRRNTKAGSIKTTKYTITFINKNRSPFSFLLHAIHAKVSKVLRAELAAINYEQHRVHHPRNGLPICQVQTCAASLEDQMVVWGPDSKNSPDRMDACLITGTKVTTNWGDIPIEKVIPGDYVQTRKGWRPVLRSDCTAVAASVFSVQLSNGETLVGTAEHPVWVQGQGWTDLNALVYGDILETCQPQMPTGPAKRPETSGSQLTAPSQRGITSIMKMGTPSTTPSKIFGASLPMSTWNSMPPNFESNDKPMLIEFATSQSPGIKAKKADPGTNNTPLMQRQHESNQHSALSAQLSSRKQIRQKATTFVQTNAEAIIGQPKHEQKGVTSRLLNVQSVAPSFNEVSTVNDQLIVHVVAGPRPAGVAEVYNLEISEVPEFYANGVLTHNCVYTLLHIFGAEHALSSRKHATIHTAANAKDLPQYDPRTDLSRPPPTLSRHSQAYNIDISNGGTENGTDYSNYPSGAGPR